MQTALLIGRFQPFHKGHLKVIKEILKANKKIIIVIGSAEKNFLSKNPLTAGERFQLIEESLKEAKIPPEKYRIIPLRDINNYALWVNHLNIYLPPYDRVYTGSKIVKACFEKYPDIEIIKLKRFYNLRSTKIRQAVLENKDWEKLLPPACSKLLIKWNIKKRLKLINNKTDK
ncbi:nicotinamide-nucleotide adenylyltransferase [Candidatus Peregrinibacteria bacterium]|nr:nicotinamide-nucleotide adenylyltransferase [Candidatus Peregrinibacteria bacterium]